MWKVVRCFLAICLAQLAQSQLMGHYMLPMGGQPYYNYHMEAPVYHRQVYHTVNQGRVFQPAPVLDSSFLRQNLVDVPAEQEQEEVPQSQPEQPAQEEVTSPPPQPSPGASILNYSSDMTSDGSYSYKYETADGISREETGIMRRSEGEGVREVRGSYSYPSPDGRVITVHYVADQGGFRVRSDQLSSHPSHNLRYLYRALPTALPPQPYI